MLPGPGMPVLAFDTSRIGLLLMIVLLVIRMENNVEIGNEQLERSDHAVIDIDENPYLQLPTSMRSEIESFYPLSDLNNYCRRPWQKWKATLKQDHFKTPWTTVSIIAASILLMLTAIQSKCSILQVKEIPPFHGLSLLRSIERKVMKLVITCWKWNKIRPKVQTTFWCQQFCFSQAAVVDVADIWHSQVAFV
ncbi:hypothetical protein Patl1_29648 [Pistacia atlantica]|uniref:Uncharacterized protein n=1 Tax=Pistacia atlantica TaxID=434234 RepID=A0ACC1AEU1_9ROSI|nr:hypothetical protein Patl1_29648 [Pistacia atlantica]